MYRVVSEEKDLESGVSDITQDNIDDSVLSDGRPQSIRSGDSTDDDDDDDNDDISFSLLGDQNPGERISQRERKCDRVKPKQPRKWSKPPRHPKGPLLSGGDHKLMREITELAMRKRARMERMKTLRRMKAAKSTSSSCATIVAMIVTLVFSVFLVLQGFSRSNTIAISNGSPAPTVSANEGLVSVQFYNEFAPLENIDQSPSTTSFRFMGHGVSGADNEGDMIDVTE